MDRFKILKNPDLEPFFDPYIPPPPREAKSASTDPRESIVNQYLSTAEGRLRLATSMANPMRSRLDFESLARRVFLVDPMPEGVLPIYEQDRNNPAFILNGENVVATIEHCDRVVVPTFDITSRPSISLASIRNNRFDLIQRAQDVALNEIHTSEMTSILQVLDRATQDSVIDIERFDNEENIKESLHNAFSMLEGIENEGYSATNVFMNAREFGSIRRFFREGLESMPGNTRDVVFPEGVPTLWGAGINISRVIPAGNIYITADQQFTGRLPIQRDITVLSADDPVERNIDWVFYENVGFYCRDPRAIVKMAIRPTEG